MIFLVLDVLVLGNVEWIFYCNFNDKILLFCLVNGNYVYGLILKEGCN